MRKIFYTLLLFNSVFIFSQNTVNCVTYKVEMALKQDVKVTNKDLLGIIEGLKSMEFKLYYNTNESIFKKIDKIGQENDRGYDMASRLVSGVYYKNQLNLEKIKQVDCYGETINVISDYQEYKWEITSETKKINGYTCYRATCVYIEDDKTRNVKKTFHPEVWFTPEIPASFGPRGLDGLPGLVLEGKINNSTVFLATKLAFNINEDVIIEKPKKGKYLTESEYQEALAKGFQNRQGE
ncbi:MAG: GLPGLI family protein [Flavobacterium sp.]